MPTRLDRPIKFITEMSGPVRIGCFEDGTIIVAGPNDRPMLIRDGGVMEVVEHQENGDLVFAFLDKRRVHG